MKLFEVWTHASRTRRLKWIGGVAFLAIYALLIGFFFRRSALRAPDATLLVRDRHGEFLGELPGAGDDRLGFWELADIPPRVAAATVAIEDRRFGWHLGIDPVAVARAVRQNAVADRRVSGASTLAMQVARMQSFDGRRRGYFRKATEMATAVALTLRHGRDGVLRHYLRIVPYGNQIHGIGYAARRYLDKPVEDLSWAEIAFLTAIPQSPARMNPYDPVGRQRAIRRGRQVLERLRAEGAIDAHEMAVAHEEITHLRLPWRGTRPAEAIHPLLAFADRLTPEARRTRPLLHSTLDLELQREVERLAAKVVEDSADRGAGNAAVLVVEVPSPNGNSLKAAVAAWPSAGSASEGWNVLAAVSSIGYFDRERAGAIDYLRIPRSSGSTLKPFLIAQALEQGVISPTSILDDLAPGPGGILNSDDRFLGPMLPRVALANSRNVPLVDLLERAGLDAFYERLGELGLHRHEEPARRYGLGLAIGSLPVTLERLVTAYTALAGEGTVEELRWIADGSDASHASDTAPAEPAPRIYTPDTARLVTLFLSDPQARLPTFPRMGFSEYPFAVAVKTGTSSRYRDAWTVAWSRRYLVGVWVGHPDERPMSSLSGYRVAARLAQSVLERLHRDQMDGLEAADFSSPRGSRPERLCALTGRRATAACDRVVLEWLPASAAGDLRDCTAHRRVAVDRRSGEIATAATPESEIEVRTFVELEPRYAGWLRRVGAPSLDEALERAGQVGVTGVTGATGSGGAGVPAIADRAFRVTITSPETGARLLFDPETPGDLNTLALRATVEPAAAQLVWYVDGVPVATVGAPYTHRWRLTPGEHVIQAKVPSAGGASQKVVVRVM